MNDAGPKGPGRPAWLCRSRAAVTYTESAIVESAREEHRQQSGVSAWHRNHSDVYLGTYAPHSNVWAPLSNGTCCLREASRHWGRFEESLSSFGLQANQKPSRRYPGAVSAACHCGARGEGGSAGDRRRQAVGRNETSMHGRLAGPRPSSVG